MHTYYMMRISEVVDTKITTRFVVMDTIGTTCMHCGEDYNGVQCEVENRFINSRTFTYALCPNCHKPLDQKGTNLHICLELEKLHDRIDDISSSMESANQEIQENLPEAIGFLEVMKLGEIVEITNSFGGSKIYVRAKVGANIVQSWYEDQWVTHAKGFNELFKDILKGEKKWTMSLETPAEIALANTSKL